MSWWHSAADKVAPDNLEEAKQQWGTVMREAFKASLRLLLVLLAVLYVVKEVPGIRNLVLEQEKGVIRLKIEKDGKIDIAKFLNSLEENKIDQNGTIGWLKERWGLYKLDDPDLKHAIIKLCPKVSELDIITYQESLATCENKYLIGNLRRLARENSPPFQRLANKIRIGTPPKENQPTDGYAYTCYNGELENKRILLTIEGADSNLEITVRGAYECLPGKKYPDIQLNERQAYTLFKRKTRKYEYAIAVLI